MPKILVPALLLAGCATSPATSELSRAAEERIGRVFHVPGLDGDRIEVQLSSGGFATAERADDGNLTVALPAQLGDVAEVAVYRGEERIGGGAVEIRELEPLSVDDVELDGQHAQISNFQIAVTPIAVDENGTTLRASVTDPFGEPLRVENIEWRGHDIETSPRDFEVAILKQGYPRDFIVDLCLVHGCYQLNLHPANFAGAFRRLGWGTAPIDFSSFANGAHSIELKIMGQFVRAGAQTLFTNNNIGGSEYALVMGDDNARGNDVAFHVRINGVDTRYTVQSFEMSAQTGDWPARNRLAAPPTVDAEWHEIAVVRDGGRFDQLHFYVDGAEIMPDTGSFTPFGGRGISGPLNLARRGDDQYYGLIDDVAIYGYARTAAELANTPPRMSGDEPGLVAAVLFDGADSRPHIKQITYVSNSAGAKVSNTRDSAADQVALPTPFQRSTFSLPFLDGETWAVVQEPANDNGIRNWAAFGWDFIYVPPGTPPAPFLDSQYSDKRRITSTVAGSVIDSYSSGWGGRNLILNAPGITDEFSWYQYMKEPPSMRVYQGSSVTPGHVVGQVDPTQRHLHIMFSLRANGGPTIPVQFSSYEVSRDYGRTWKPIAAGMPRIGEWVRRAGPVPPLVDAKCENVAPGFSIEFGCP